MFEDDLDVYHVVGPPQAEGLWFLFGNVHGDEDGIVFMFFHGDADVDLNVYQVVGKPQAEELFHVDVLNIMLIFTKLLAHHSQRSSFSEFFL